MEEIYFNNAYFCLTAQYNISK